MDKNKVFGEKNFFKGFGMWAPWKKFGQKMKNLEIFFDIFDFHACLYMHIKFRQNRTKFGSVRASFSKTGRHGISIFTNFNHLRIIFESGYMRWLLSFFLPYAHLRLTVIWPWIRCVLLFFRKHFHQKWIHLFKHQSFSWMDLKIVSYIPL